MPLLNFVKHIAVYIGFCVLSFVLPVDKLYADSSSVFTVVIDPGHGGRDPGAVGAFSHEKDIALSISLKAGEYLKKHMDSVKIIYTRTTDVHVELADRAEIANKNNADLFVSIHVNAAPKKDKRPRGTSSYVLGLHRSDEALETAKRENSVILLEEDYSTRYEGFDPNSEESYIMFSFMANFFDKQSIEMARLVQNQFRERAKRKDLGVRRLGLLVLARLSMPGILIETGFITNPDEEKYLNTAEGQDYIASAIYRAIKEYIYFIQATSTNDATEELSNTISENRTEVISVENNDISSDNIKTVNDNNTDSASTNSYAPFFKVQVLVSKNPIDLGSDIFRDFNDVEEYYSNGKYKYAVGYGSSYEEIGVYSKLVKNRFPDAFIVGIENGKIVSAKSIQKQLEP